MNFLNTTILLFATLALLPILIHLFNRQRIKRIEFSSIRYLKALQKTKMRRLKLKQLILLILRTLIILALVFAFARPSTRGSYSSVLGSSAQASVVIAIDNSLSMLTETKEGTLLDLARQQAINVCDNIATGDEIAVISFNNTVVQESNGYSTNKSFIKSTINAVSGSHNETNPERGIENAFELIKTSQNLLKEIYIFSDLAGNEWRNFSPDSVFEDKNLKIYLCRLNKDDYDNLKVSRLDFGNSLIYPGRPAEITAQISNEKSERVSNLLVSLYIDEKRIAQEDVSLASMSSEKVTFSHSFELPGEHSGYVEITDDDLLEDNRRYFTINIPDKIRILSITENADDDRYLKMALRPLPETPTQTEVNSERLLNLPSLELANYDVVVLTGLKYLSQANLSKLINYVKSGGSLVFFISDDNNKDALNEKVFGPLFGCRLETVNSVSQGEGFFRLSSLDYNHPVFSRFREISEDYLPEVDIYNLVKSTQPSKGKVLASFSTGDPAILEASHEKGKILAILTTPLEKDSDIINHPFFVTFMNRTVEYLAYNLNRLKENYLTGNSFAKTILNNLPEKSVILTGRNDFRISPAYTFSGTELNISVPSLSYAGIYSIEIDDKLNQKFAVNFSPYESNGKFLEADDFRTSMKGLTVIDLPTDDNQEQVISESRIGKELSKFFIIAALILLAAEMILPRGSEIVPAKAS